MTSNKFPLKLQVKFIENVTYNKSPLKNLYLCFSKFQKAKKVPKTLLIYYRQPNSNIRTNFTNEKWC